jgi:hypothetical protein
MSAVDHLRPEVKLLPGERLEAVRELDLRDPERMPDALDELCKLTGVERPEEIGQNGPAVGARVTEQNADETALRLFEVVFGRDSLTVALVVDDLFPRLLEATVLYLAGIQGREFDALREDEPGRIAHEIRDIETNAPSSRCASCCHSSSSSARPPDPPRPESDAGAGLEPARPEGHRF